MEMMIDLSSSVELNVIIIVHLYIMDIIVPYSVRTIRPSFILVVLNGKCSFLYSNIQRRDQVEKSEKYFYSTIYIH